MSEVLCQVSTLQSVHIAGAQRMVVLIKVIIRVVNSIIIIIIIMALIRASALLGSFPTLKHWTWTLRVIHFNSMQRNTL